MQYTDHQASAGQIKVRRARAADRPAVDALNRALQSYEAPMRLSRAAPDAIPAAYLDEIFLRKAEGYGDLLVATLGRDIVGFVAWAAQDDPLEADPAEIVVTDLIVAEGHRGAGIGRALVASVRAAAAARAVRRVFVTTLVGNANAQAAYAALGFRPASVTFELDALPPEGRKTA